MVVQWIRKSCSLAATAAFVLMTSGHVSAQNTSNSQAQVSESGNSAAGQTMSLGDVARAARAARQSEPKAARVIDDDNLTRNGAGISVVGGSGGRPFPAAGSSGRSASKVILLDFWASWCGPCRQSVPDLKQLQKVFGPDQIEVVSINEDRNESAGRNFVTQNDMTWEQQFDSTGETARQYGVRAFPTFILTDQNGNVLEKFLGEDPSEPLSARIAPYMKGQL